jgi:uncharacterized protein
MSNQIDGTAKGIAELSRLHGYVAKSLYIMETEPIANIGPVLENLEAHLGYWVDLENKNILFAGGPRFPIDENDAWAGIGIVMFRAGSFEEATTIAANDPMHLSGARRFKVTPWLLNHLNVATASK